LKRKEQRGLPTFITPDHKLGYHLRGRGRGRGGGGSFGKREPPIGKKRKREK